jgi:biotin carboxyl carrier protein
MSTYVALLDGGRREETIGVAPSGPGIYEVRIGGKVHRVDVFQHDYGTISMIVDTESYSVQLDEVDPTTSSGKTVSSGKAVKVHVRGTTYPLEILDERLLRMRRATGKFTVEGKQTITSPLPGKVVKVLAKAGDVVKEGQGVVVVEAMKMENELSSPKGGTVTELLVVEGQAVEGGAKLAVVE